MTKFKAGDILLFLFFLSLILVLIVLSDWEYDEAWTFNEVSKNNFVDLLLYSKYQYANNHLLNSLYFKVIQVFSGEGVYWYRGLSLLGFCMFFYANLKILKMLGVNYYLIIFLILAPYFIYFSLGRGYGLAIGAFSLSFLFLIESIIRPSKKNEYQFVFFGLLSVLSIFSFLFSFLSMCMVLAYYKKNRLFNVHVIFQIFIIISVLGYVYYAGKIVNDFDPNIIGSESLLKGGTLSSVLSDFSHHYTYKHISFYWLLKLVVASGFIVSVLYLLKVRYAANLIKQKVIFLLILVPVISLIGMVVANLLLDAKFPMGRSVMYLHYMALLFVIVIFSPYTKKLYYLPITSISLASILFIVSVFHNLSRPSLEDVLEISRGSSLYVNAVDGSLMLTRQLSGDDFSTITQRSDMSSLNDIIDQDTRESVYLFTHFSKMDEVIHPVVEKIVCRGGGVLLRLSLD